MKVFLSWSGETSHHVAIALHRWLPYMLHHIKPFLSSADIKKGDRWSNALAVELQDAKYSIICVTPYNVNKPWMNFEAGALSKIIGSSFVAPFLFRLDRSGIQGPLSQFQVTVFLEDEMFNLLLSLNSALKPGKQLSHELLSRNFKIWWKRLENELNDIKNTKENETETEHDWLFSRNDLIRAEAKGDYNLIWIITPDPFEHALKSDMEKMVIDNLKNGITYRYIVPDSPDIEGDITQIKLMAGPYPGQLDINNVARKCFSKQAVTDYIIMNPDSGPPHKLRVFLKLPVGSGEFWIEVKNEHAAIGFKDRFKAWVEEYPSIPEKTPQT